MDINKEIAQKVRALRIKRSFSQENIADMLGISRVNYVNMEAGKQNWMPHYIYNLCRIFKCRPSDLFPKVTPVKIKSTVKRRVVVRKKRIYSKV
jgi:DNA-binding XRE family transcriptional regulator